MATSIAGHHASMVAARRCASGRVGCGRMPVRSCPAGADDVAYVVKEELRLLLVAAILPNAEPSNSWAQRSHLP